MQTIKQKLALARWRDKKFVYHPADSHCDASEFRARMEEYARLSGMTIANAELVQLRGKR